MPVDLQDSTTLTAVHWQAIAALMQDASVVDATRRANVDRRTSPVKNNAALVAELNRATQEQAETGRAQLRQLAVQALITIQEMLGKDRRLTYA